MKTYQIQIDVTVDDLARLRAYALRRALDAKFRQDEFEQAEQDDPEDNVSYWLGWAFDSGTPFDSGFTIEESRVEAN